MVAEYLPRKRQNPRGVVFYEKSRGRPCQPSNLPGLYIISRKVSMYSVGLVLHLKMREPFLANPSGSKSALSSPDALF